jgi:glucose/arabinose dehydrogenase
MRFTGAAGVALCIVLTLSVPSYAGPPKGFSVRTIVTGLNSPTAFAYAPGGRIFITEKSGVVHIFYKGRLHKFLDISDDVNRFSDRGLLSVAVDPAFERNRRVYLLFTEELNRATPDTRNPAGGALIRIEASRGDPTVADLSTRITLVSGFKSTGPWHSVGGLDFDGQGRLILGFGDGSPYCRTKRCLGTGVVEPYEASAYAPYDLNSLSGKVLRINPETGAGVPGNPYYDPKKPDRVSSMILARGVRTPFRVQVDRKTGEIYVGDVGTDQWEEINLIPTSWNDPTTELNFGWPCYEGGDNGIPEQASIGGALCESEYYDAERELTTPPWFAYSVERGAALILGPHYRGNGYPSEYVGDLFFGDWKRDAFWTYSDEHAKQFGTSGGWGQPVDIDISPGGNLAYLGIGTGRLNEIVYIGGVGSDAGEADVGLWMAYGAAVLGGLLVFGIWVLNRRKSDRSRAST